MKVSKHEDNLTTDLNSTKYYKVCFFSWPLGLTVINNVNQVKCKKNETSKYITHNHGDNHLLQLHYFYV